jgi:dihydropteroate synthase
LILKTRAKDLDLSKGPLLMGILNVTPDSFSDGGRYASVEAAVARAETMIAEGADLIDVGGESTRPGADPVTAEEELRRTAPVIEALRARRPSVPISIDTTKSLVARRALEAGASLVNDVSALRDDPSLIRVIREHDVPVVMMHRRGDPRTMQANPVYENVVNEIKDFLSERMDWAVRGGLRPDQFIIDPGIGFGKTTAHNVEILKNLRSFLELEQPLLIGASLKSFIGKIVGEEADPSPTEERVEGTLAAHLWSAAHGAHILRVHDVAAHRRALAVYAKFMS